MLITAVGFVLCVCACALLYRLGGFGKDGKLRFPKVPLWMFNTKMRDWGCPAVCVGWMVFTTDAAWWVHAIAFLGMFGSMVTYWDDMFDGVDNFYMHGFVAGCAFAPYFWGGVDLGLICLRALILGAGMGIWCRVFSNDDVEELGRGALLALTLALLGWPA